MLLIGASQTKTKGEEEYLSTDQGGGKKMVAAVFGVNYFSLAVNAFMRSGSWGLSRSRASALRQVSKRVEIASDPFGF